MKKNMIKQYEKGCRKTPESTVCETISVEKAVAEAFGEVFKNVK